MRPTLALFLLLFPLLLAPAAAAQPDARADALAAIREEIGALSARLEAVRGREAGLEGREKRLKLELELQEAELAEATAAHELATERAADAETRIGELEAALDGLRDDLKRRLAGLYRLGRHGYLRLFFSLEPDADLLPAIRQLRFLVRRDRAVIDRFTATRDRLAVERRRLEDERRDAELWRERERERRDELAAARLRYQRALARLQAERWRLEQKSRDLREKERKLARLIDSLVDADRAALAGTPIDEFRGVLDWPVRGEVVGEFGSRLDPRYGTEVPRNGIDVAAAGREIRAVFPGEVLYASVFEGYGPMVVVHHPGRVFTLYAGLAQLRVEKGDVISLGQVVGVAAGDLYFEIRRENQPEDPLTWLR